MYLTDQKAAKAEAAAQVNGAISNRLQGLREQLSAAETAFDTFKREQKIVTSDGGVFAEQQLSKLNGELATARAVAAESKAREDQIAAALKSGAGPDMLPDAIRSNLIQKLREQYSQVARRAAALESQLQPRHPVLIDVRSQLAAVKTQINDELKRIATASKAEAQIAGKRVQEVESQIDRVKDEVARTNTAQIHLRELEQEVTTSREMLRTFLARAKETQEQENVATADARVITPASLPIKPSRPIPLLVLALGLLGGLGLGLASALGSDHFNTNIRTPSDFAPYLPPGSVSAIPALGASSGLRSLLRGRRRGPRIDAAQFSDLLSALADYKGVSDSAYRQAVLRLLSRIKQRQKPGRPHTVLLAAPEQGAGNSATALSLAYAAALGGERVLLVDATSSNPELSKIFATSLKPDNLVVLDNKEHMASITVHDEKTGLAFLPIALVDLRALKNQQRRRLIAGLNGLIQRYDMVFIDAGGVLEDEAALCLLPAADQVLLVGRTDATTRSQVSEAIDALELAHDRLTGAVLTMAT